MFAPWKQSYDSLKRYMWYSWPPRYFSLKMYIKFYSEISENGPEKIPLAPTEKHHLLSCL